MNAVDECLEKAKADLLEAGMEAIREYACRRVWHGATTEQINTELQSFVPEIEALRQKGVKRLNAIATRPRPQPAISGARLAGVHLRVALRKLQEEQRAGRPLVIEQIDVCIHEDASGVGLWVYPRGAHEFLITVPLSPDEVQNFRHREWKHALEGWVEDR